MASQRFGGGARALLALLCISFPCIAADADALAARARQAAHADRNAESAHLFAEAIEAAPQRRAEWLREYGEQLVYSGHAEEAIPLLRERLGTPGMPEDDRIGTLRALALALSWTDRLAESAAVYRRVLAERPDDVDASRGLARVTSWSGRQREAGAMLRQYLARHPDDAEARVLLAQSEWWLGRPDLASQTLRLPGLGERGDAKKLSADIARELAPRSIVRAQRSTQSDDLEIQAAAVETQWRMNEGLTRIAPRVEAWRYIADGPHDVEDVRPGAHVHHRFGDDWELNVDGGLERIRPEAAPDYSKLTYGVWLTAWANDRLRFDLSTNRNTFDNVTSLERQITARRHGISTDVAPDERTKLALRADYSDYSDGNRRRFAQAEGEWRTHAHPDLWIGARFTHFDFSELLDNGYFNPLNYNAYLVTSRIEGHGEDWRWSYALFGRYGREFAHPDGEKPIYEVGARAAYRIDRAWEVEARLENFSSRTASASGFARTTAALSLLRIW